MADDTNRICREKEYEMISKRVGDIWASSHDAIKLFIQMFAAILGGSIWLATRGKVAPIYEWGSDLLVAILVGLCGTMLWDNKGSWLQWRGRLDEITRGTDTSIVKFPRQSWIKENGMELISTATMFIALGVFWWFNPFQAARL